LSRCRFWDNDGMLKPELLNGKLLNDIMSILLKMPKCQMAYY
jgi:hypothetical protein